MRHSPAAFSPPVCLPNSRPSDLIAVEQEKRCYHNVVEFRANGFPLEIEDPGNRAVDRALREK
jgi:hypothetical protein